MTRRRAALRLFLSAVSFAAVVAPVGRDAAAADTFVGKDVTAQRVGGVFELTDQHGRRRRLTDFKGKAVLLFFGYTRCPDVCPTTLARLAQTMTLLGPAAERVQVLWVTVDPERDTQELLSHYMPAFDASFLGLRGSVKETSAVADAFKVDYQITYYKNEVLVDHSAFGYLIDPSGRTRVKIPYDETAAQIARDVSTVLAGG
jgi:protein SCO1/2